MFRLDLQCNYRINFKMKSSGYTVIDYMGDYEMQSVCAWVGGCVRVCMRPLVCHADCSETIAVTFFFSKKSPNEFLCPSIFSRFAGLGLKIKRVIAIFATLSK